MTTTPAAASGPALRDRPDVERPAGYLIAVGTSRYDELPAKEQLPSVHRDLQIVESTFVGRMKYERVLGEIAEDPTSQTLRSALGDWFIAPERTSSDVVTFYFSGHGATWQGKHYLLTRDSRPEVPHLALETDAIVSMAAAGAVGHLLVIIDTCESGHGIADLGTAMNRVSTWSRTGSSKSLFLLSSTRALELGQGSNLFPQALADAIDNPRVAGQRQEWLDLGSVTRSINDDLRTARVRQRARWAAAEADGHCLPLPNPAFRAGLPQGLDIAEQRRAVSSIDLLEHWGPRGRGVQSESQPGWYFSGRTAVLEALASYVDGTSGGWPPYAVTGSPGSGKSAVLARLVTLADPTYRRSIPPDSIPPGTAPAVGGIDAAVHARGKTLSSIVAALAESLCSASSEPEALVAELIDRPGLTTIVLDALDEALEPGRVATELLQRITLAGPGSGIKLIVGTRREYLPLLGRNIRPLNLDVAQYLRTDDLRDYVRALLLADDDPTAETHYRDHPAKASEVAAVVAARATPSFLIARLTAQSLMTEPPPERVSTGWVARLPRTVEEALDAYLRRFGSAEKFVRDLLLPLAYAEGSGLPWDTVWPAVASELAGVAYSDDDVSRLLANAGSFVLEASEQGRSVYRLYHQALADHLRQADGATAQQRITAALLTTVPPDPDGHRDWARAHLYVRTHLATHAAATPQLNDLLLDPDYLIRAESARLLRVLPQATDERAVAAADAYQRVARVLPRDDREAALSALELAAVQSSSTALRAAVRDRQRTPTWRPTWAQWKATTSHLIVGGFDSAPARLSLLPADDRTFLFGSSEDGQVRMWDLASGDVMHDLEAAGPVLPVGLPEPGFVGGDEDDRIALVRFGAAGLVQVLPEQDDVTWEQMCTAVGANRTFVAAVGREPGRRRVWVLWDATSGEVVWRRTERIPRFGRSRPTVLCASRLDAGPEVLVSIDADGDVRVLRLADGQPIAAIKAGEGVLGERVDASSAAVSLAATVTTEDLDAMARVPVGLLPELHLATAGDDFAVLRSGRSAGWSKLGAATAVETTEGPAGHLFLVGNADGSIDVFDGPSGDQLGDPLEGHSAAVTTLAAGRLNGDPILVSGGRDGAVRLWNAAQFLRTKPAEHSAPDDGPVPDHRLGESARSDDDVEAYGVRALCTVTARGKPGLVAVSRARLSVWDRAGVLRLRETVGETSSVVAIHAVDDAVICADFSGALEKWRVGPSLAQWGLAAAVSSDNWLNGRFATCLTAISDGPLRRVFAGTSVGEVHVLDLDTLEMCERPFVLHRVAPRRVWINSIAATVVAGRTTVVSEDNSGLIWMWHPDSPRGARRLAATGSGYGALTIGEAPDGQRLFWSTVWGVGALALGSVDDGDAATDREMTWSGRVTALTVGRRGGENVLVVGGSQGHVSVHSLTSLEQTEELEVGAWVGGLTSSDGLVFVATDRGLVGIDLDPR